MVVNIRNMTNETWARTSGALLISAVLVFLMGVGLCLAEPVEQHMFGSPEEAIKAMISALESKDGKALEAILGPDSEEIISSGDPVADEAGRQRFIRLYEEKHFLEKASGERVFLHVGRDDWPFPIPIAKRDSLWRFDTQEGSGEILARRIGRNELSTIQVCLAYVDAQKEYARKDRDGDGLLSYAQKFRSDPGKRDGLYWEAGEGVEESPLGPLLAEAQEKGYDFKKEQDRPSPYHGYYYRILKAQGKNASGGGYDYMAKDKMIGGFALLAYPAQYGASGIMTFMVNHDGIVYEKDLGEHTAKEAQAMTLFNPDSTWQKVGELQAQIKK
jgi:hypothetical protein